MICIPIIILLSLCQISFAKYPIQAHSFNEIGYVGNLISKGVDNYKLDVSLANRKSCEQFSTWNKTQKCIVTSQYIEEICCLAMRGDGSSSPDFNYPFNTSS